MRSECAAYETTESSRREPSHLVSVHAHHLPVLHHRNIVEMLQEMELAVQHDDSRGLLQDTADQVLEHMRSNMTVQSRKQIVQEIQLRLLHSIRSSSRRHTRLLSTAQSHASLSDVSQITLRQLLQILAQTQGIQDCSVALDLFRTPEEDIVWKRRKGSEKLVQ